MPPRGGGAVARQSRGSLIRTKRSAARHVRTSASAAAIGVPRQPFRASSFTTSTTSWRVVRLRGTPHRPLACSKFFLFDGRTTQRPVPHGRTTHLRSPKHVPSSSRRQSHRHERPSVMVPWFLRGPRWSCSARFARTGAAVAVEASAVVSVAHAQWTPAVVRASFGGVGLRLRGHEEISRGVVRGGTLGESLILMLTYSHSHRRQRRPQITHPRSMCETAEVKREA
ncbi:hypothetical protein C2E23DRAFT_267306 [Lenzites betulinus]|nr:hypothetical protein C2E23DRAFT_267306 [Lenzites betulinus]